MPFGPYRNGVPNDFLHLSQTFADKTANSPPSTGYPAFPVPNPSDSSTGLIILDDIDAVTPSTG